MAVCVFLLVCLCFFNVSEVKGDTLACISWPRLIITRPMLEISSFAFSSMMWSVFACNVETELSQI